ncbi:MAG: hypothetical protein AB1813_23780 [Verrucomicrobiota bacterium]
MNPNGEIGGQDFLGSTIGYRNQKRKKIVMVGRKNPKGQTNVFEIVDAADPVGAAALVREKI